MSEQPVGCTGERCKADGTYTSDAGAKQYFADGESFGVCPIHGKETRWVKAT